MIDIWPAIFGNPAAGERGAADFIVDVSYSKYNLVWDRRRSRIAGVRDKQDAELINPRYELRVAGYEWWNEFYLNNDRNKIWYKIINNI